MIYDVLRWYTLCTAVVTAALGTPQWRRFKRFMPENQYAWLAVVAFNASVFLGALRALTLHAPGSYATVANATAVTFALCAASYRPARWARMNWWRLFRAHRQP